MESILWSSVFFSFIDKFSKWFSLGVTGMVWKWQAILSWKLYPVQKHLQYLLAQWFLWFLQFLVSSLQKYLSPPCSQNIFIHTTHNKRNVILKKAFLTFEGSQRNVCWTWVSLFLCSFQKKKKTTTKVLTYTIFSLPNFLQIKKQVAHGIRGSSYI